MRNTLMLVGLLAVGSIVGCYHTDSGCSTCGCNTGCGSGCGSSCSSSFGHKHTCTTGVCDCDVPPLAPYGAGLGITPHVPPPAAPIATPTTEAPREMPKAEAEVANK
jgi:hypothetical protein